MIDDCALSRLGSALCPGRQSGGQPRRIGAPKSMPPHSLKPDGGCHVQICYWRNSSRNDLCNICREPRRGWSVGQRAFEIRPAEPRKSTSCRPRWHEHSDHRILVINAKGFAEALRPGCRGDQTPLAGLAAQSVLAPGLGRVAGPGGFVSDPPTSARSGVFFETQARAVASTSGRRRSTSSLVMPGRMRGS